MTFPPFAGFVRRVVLANVIVFFAVALLGAFGIPGTAFLIGHLELTPALVMRGEIWQLLTYSFLHFSLLGTLLNMLGLWFIGSFLESSCGSRWTAELYFASVLGTALTAMAIAYGRILHQQPGLTLAGSSGAIFGVFIGFAVLFGEQEIMLFPLPVRIRAKYLAVIYILLELYPVIRGEYEDLVYLGGALAGYLFAKFAPQRGLLGGTSEWYFGLRNAYYRNKRRRAAKKFEVYMGKQGRDVRFDKDGKYIDPDKDSNKWVN